MRREASPRSPALTRRTFLVLAPAAVGTWVRSVRAGPATDRASGPEPARAGGEHVLSLRVPDRTGNGARVPIVLESPHPMVAGHHVTEVRVTNDGDPISSKGTFHFTAANGRVHLAFQARMHEGSSTVTATAECSAGSTFAAASRIEIPAGAGGCGGAAPRFARTPGDDIRGPVIRIPELVERGRILEGEPIRVQVMMRHPNRTGLVFRDGRFVQESDPIHLDAMEVFWDREQVSSFAMTSALSDDPLITFGLLARRGRLRVVLTNSRARRFEARYELPVA